LFKLTPMPGVHKATAPDRGPVAILSGRERTRVGRGG